MTTALEGGEGSASRPGLSLPRERPFVQEAAQGRSGQVRKISPPPGFNPRTVQSVASHYTDDATRPNSTYIQLHNYKSTIIHAFHPTSLIHFTTLHSPFFTSRHFWTFRHRLSKNPLLFLTYNYFPNPLSKNMRFTWESR